MTTSEVRTEAAFGELEELRDRPSLWKRFRGFARKQPLGTAGAFVVVLYIVVAAFAPWITPFDPVDNDYSAMFTPPGWPYLMGTDEYGRDILSRVIAGSRTALFVGFSCAIVGATVGMVLGVAAAYWGGIIDLMFERVNEVFLAFPLIVMALAIVSISRSFQVSAEDSVYFVIIAITIPFIPRCARVVRSSALSIREIPYIDAARANGYSDARIILRHMAPNVMAPFLIMITAFVGQAILLEASLSFLGLGVQDPLPAWGLMLRNAQAYIRTEPWIAIWPGVAISLGVFGFNLFGDAVRDALDPKLRSQ
ncbi:MAG TPA: ABC transporter permease [Paracoccaceae bacterium]|nr:ABC transporter permease [Paracoccaceae bacterium]